MSKFTDASGAEWSIDFDCFVLDKVRKESEVDLADVSAGGLLAVERDVTALGRVLVAVCEEQRVQRGTSPRDFLKSVRGDALTRAREAVLDALADFFPASEWSAMQSNLTTRKNRNVQMEELSELAPAFAALPETMKMKLLEEGIAEYGNSQLSPDGASALPPAAMQPTPAVDSPVSAESAPGAYPSETSG